MSEQERLLRKQLADDIAVLTRAKTELAKKFRKLFAEIDRLENRLEGAGHKPPTVH